MIRNTLSSLPIYFMSLFVIPKRVRMRLEMIQRDFLSGGGNLGKKAYLVSWTTICTDKKGGLGIRSLSLLNRALLESGVGDMFLKGKSCGSKLKRGNMGRKEQASTLCEVGGGYGVGVWKAIRKGWNLFFSKTSFEVSNGRRVKFWTIRWCVEEPLCTFVPSLYALALSKEA